MRRVPADERPAVGGRGFQAAAVDGIGPEPVAADVMGLFTGQVCVMIHSGSRGLGHQVGTDHLKVMDGLMRRLGIEVPDRQLACVPLGHEGAERYLGAMNAAANFARANRHVLADAVRESFDAVFERSARDPGLLLVYDVSHNLAKFEEHEVEGRRRRLCVHRKGATRAFGPGHPQVPAAYRGIGQPVLIPGSMGTASFVEPGPMANDGILDELEEQDGPEGPGAPDAPDTDHRDRGPRVPKNAIPYPPTDQAWSGSLRRTPGMSRQRLARLGWQALDPMSDNVFLRLRMSDEIAGVFLAAIEGARQNLEQSVRATAGLPSGSPPSVAAARLSIRRGDPVPAWAGLLAVLEEYVRIWDEPKAMPRRRWDPTYERDGWRCMAPGCTARCRLEDHHIHYRAHLGSDEPWNQLCLCEFHHQHGEHGRLARCRGTAPLHVVWRLGRPDLATWWRNGRRLPPPTNLQDWGAVVTASSSQSAASAEPPSLPAVAA